jgi:hypothetical protein
MKAVLRMTADQGGPGPLWVDSGCGAQRTAMLIACSGAVSSLAYFACVRSMTWASVKTLSWTPQPTTAARPRAAAYGDAGLVIGVLGMKLRIVRRSHRTFGSRLVVVDFRSSAMLECQLASPVTDGGERDAKVRRTRASSCQQQQRPKAS